MIVSVKGLAVRLGMAGLVIAILPSFAAAESVSCEGAVQNGQAAIYCTYPHEAKRDCTVSWTLKSNDGASFEWTGSYSVNKGDDHSKKLSISAHPTSGSPIAASSGPLKLSCKKPS
jgi:hypothetical protein